MIKTLTMREETDQYRSKRNRARQYRKTRIRAPPIQPRSNINLIKNISMTEFICPSSIVRPRKNFSVLQLAFGQE